MESLRTLQMDFMLLCCIICFLGSCLIMCLEDLDGPIQRVSLLKDQELLHDACLSINIFKLFFLCFAVN